MEKWTLIYDMMDYINVSIHCYNSTCNKNVDREFGQR